MNWSKSLRKLSALLLLTSIATIDLSELVVARPLSNTTPNQMAQRRRLNFRVGVRSSRFRVGGFSRAASCGGQQDIVALVPPPQAQPSATRQKANQEPVDKTISDRPTLFIYVPYTTEKAAQFTLQNEAGNKELYNISFKLPGKPGIVGIALPAKGPALEVGQKYLWQVSVACSPNDDSNMIAISSWVERVHPSTSTPNQIAELAEQGIWQDALAGLALARLRQGGDRQVNADWAALMEDAGLPQFKQTEIVQLIKN